MADNTENASTTSSSQSSTCPLCESLDDDKMVQCDDCNTFFHFKCVKVDSSVANRPWSCARCTKKQKIAAKETTKTPSPFTPMKTVGHSPKKVDPPPLKKPVKQPTPTGSDEKTLPKITESGEHAKALKQLKHTGELLTKSTATIVELRKTHASEIATLKAQMEEQANIVQEAVRSANESRKIAEEATVELRKSNDEAARKAEAETQELRQQLASLRETIALPQAPATPLTADDHSIIDDNVEAVNTVGEDILAQQVGIAKAAEATLRETTALSTLAPATEEFLARMKEMMEQLIQNSVPRAQSAPLPSHSAPSVNVFDDAFDSNSSSGNQSQSMERLTTTMRRQYLQKLPTFSGNIKEWAAFEHIYNQTTIEGRFTPSDNVARLREALKPPASQLVLSLILYSSDADRIMEELKDAYGKPDDLIAVALEEIFALPELRSEVDPGLRNLMIHMRNYVATLDSLGATSELTGIFTLRRVLPKLHHHHQTEWLELKQKKPDANLRDFADFLVRKVKQIPLSLHTARVRPTQSTSNTQPPENRNRRVLAHHQAESVRSDGCCKCSGQHQLSACREFLNLPLKDKYELLYQKRLCSACLKSSSHRWRECPTKRACGVDNCAKFHHRSLHKGENRPSGYRQVTETNNNPTARIPNVNANSFNPRQPPASGNVQHHAIAIAKDRQLTTQPVMSHADSEPILFKIVPIIIHGRFGSIDTYAFLDDGSSLTLLEQDIFDKLHLEGVQKELYLQWSNGIVRKEDSFITEISVAGGKSKQHHTLTNVFTVKNLDLPSQTVDAEKLKRRHAHIRGLPIPSMINAKPRILIGLRHSSFLNGPEYHSAGDDAPVACKTRLGWTVYGLASSDACPIAAQSDFTSGVQLSINQATVNDNELSAMVKEFFSTENFGVMPAKRDLVSEAEQRANEIMRNSLKLVDGRYEIGLLWKHDNVRLPNSYAMALNRLRVLERSLKKKPELLAWKNNHVRLLVEKGYARKASESELNQNWQRIWYCPTFVTFNANKVPPKPRDVADVAATVNGESLNSNLLKGPDNMAPLLQALFKFRENFIAVNADVKEMFHQISIKPEDQQCQRFLWRDGDDTMEPSVYIMQRMMFGPTCSPTCAQFVKNTHADKFLESHPEAAKAIKKTTYVDDYFNSHGSLDEAKRVIRDAVEICESMGFNLVSFQSNEPRALEGLSPDIRKSTTVAIDSRESQVETSKLLGIVWHPQHDYINYKVNRCELVEKMINTDYRPTKREMLRTLMRIFDPLGLIAHFLIRGKIVLQEVWREGVEWDEPVNDTLRVVWQEFITQLPNIAKIRIHRHYAPVIPAEQEVQLIIFVDASEKAFAGIAYFRFSKDGVTHIAQVMGKAKVAPIKKLTIPQLELQAAVLGVRMCETIKKMHDFPIHHVTFLSDSRVVLAWISSRKFNFKMFVASRVGEILDTSTPKQWFHVGTKENVADDATKYTDPSVGDNDTRWFLGPEFLRLEPETWPVNPASACQAEVENSATYLSMFHCPHIHATEPLTTIDNISPRFRARWSSLSRVTAFLLRLSTKRRQLEEFPGNFISPDEFRAAEDTIFKKIQHDTFQQEIKDLAAEGTVSRSSKIYKLSPCLVEGIVRMRSRAQKANISYASRNPAILPNKHELVDVFIQHHHEKNLHMGDEMIIADLRERAWIIDIRSAVKRVKRNCQHCKNQRAKPQMPLMGELPLARVDFGVKPFTHTGLDAFGPYILKRARSNIKRYGIIFTCLTYRAVHLEVLDEMTTDSCILAIRRFLVRRGWSSRFYSDNGTNFKGARNLLHKELAEIQSSLPQAASNCLSIRWQFIPAYSPWFGGAWERLIQSVKKCIDYVMRDEEPSETVFRNAIIEAEFWMNRRPLTHAPIDHEDSKPLTPNSVLFGDDQEELASLLGVYTVSDKFSVKAHRRVQHLVEKFRHRWNKEYLPQINRRSKWYETANPLKIGDVVIITEPNQGRDAWRRGRVITVHAGADGEVRAADIMLADKTIIKNRSTGRLAVLDVLMQRSTDENQSPGSATLRQYPTQQLEAQCSAMVDANM